MSPSVFRNFYVKLSWLDAPVNFHFSVCTYTCRGVYVCVFKGQFGSGLFLGELTFASVRRQKHSLTLRGGVPHGNGCTHR